MNRLRVNPALLAAARVAALTTLLAAALYTLAAVALLAFAQRVLIDTVDSQLSAALSASQQARPPDPATASAVDFWVVGSSGGVVLATKDAPTLPSSLSAVTGPRSASIGGAGYRLVGGPFRFSYPLGSPAEDGWLIVGQPTRLIDQALVSLAVTELMVGVPLLAVIFLIALAIGRLSAAPIERARRRQLEFTADASHELRTPLQVIEAEVSLALQRERGAEAYRATIQRVQAESGRLRRLVDDLLWLARFDNQPKPPPPDLVDLRGVAAEAVQRFEAVAARRGQSLTLVAADASPALISAPAPWIERLAGVIVDNACRYSPEGGSIRLVVDASGGRSRIAVEDTGPGIPPAERVAIFERFHRATQQGGGSGLGLAIGNAVVQATDGRWEIGDGGGVGARVAVSWEPPRRPRGEPLRSPATASELPPEASS